MWDLSEIWPGSQESRFRDPGVGEQPLNYIDRVECNVYIPVN